MLTDEQLDEIRARLDRANYREGYPWCRSGSFVSDAGMPVTIVAREPDAKFIAHAPSDIDALLRTVEEVRKQLWELQAKHEDLVEDSAELREEASVRGFDLLTPVAEALGLPREGRSWSLGEFREAISARARELAERAEAKDCRDPRVDRIANDLHALVLIRAIARALGVES